MICYWEILAYKSMGSSTPNEGNIKASGKQTALQKATSTICADAKSTGRELLLLFMYHITHCGFSGEIR